MKINILGQDYNIKIQNDEENPKLKNADGLAELYSKDIVIRGGILEEAEETFDDIHLYADKVLRHEIIHAYFHEAGLSGYCDDEVLIDWLAIQIPKISRTIEQSRGWRENKDM